MSTIALVILGVIAGSVLWIFLVAWLLDVIGGQRQKLSDQALSIRFYRDSRDESDRQVRDLIGQNSRLAAKLIELAAREAAATKPAAPVIHAQLWPGRES